MVSSMAQFFWGHMNKSKGIHWRSWKKLAKAKFISSLGFRDLEAFNKALFAKQVWRLLQHLDSLVGQILKA